jgi:hypothetical protein
MTPHTQLSEHAVLWRVLMVTPGGYVEVVEVRAPNEATALDTVRSWKPCHWVATEPSGNPLILGRPAATTTPMTKAMTEWGTGRRSG